MKLKSGKISFVLFFVLFLYQIYSQQAYYGFYNKFYTGILGNGEHSNTHMYDSTYNLNLWMHYNHYWESSYYDKGWTDWIAGDLLNANFSDYGEQIKVILEGNGANYRSVSARIKIESFEEACPVLDAGGSAAITSVKPYVC